MQYFDEVEHAYDELVASGDVHDVPPGNVQEQEINEQKAYVTRRAAYYINLRDVAYGLLSKTSETNVQGLSTDIVIKRDGIYYDIATDVDLAGGYKAVEVRNGSGILDTSLIDRWVQPTKEMAGLGGVVEPPTTPPTTPGTVDEKLDLIIKMLTSYHNEEMEAITKPRITRVE